MAVMLDGECPECGGWVCYEANTLFRFSPLCKDCQKKIDDSKPKFKCRICGSEEYKAIFPKNGVLGSQVYASHFKCKGCSVLFQNVELFTVK